MRVRRGVLGRVVAVVAAILAIAMVALALGRSGTPSEAKDIALPSTTVLASTTAAPVPTEPSTTVAATSTTLPVPTTTVAATPAAPTTTITPVAVATTTTSSPPVVAGQPEVVSTTAAPTTIATTTTFVPITMVTVFFPPVLQIVTTTTRALQPVDQYSFQDITVTFQADPHPLFDPTPNCLLIHSPTEISAFTSTVMAGWTIDVTKGDVAHPGISDIIDLSNFEAQLTLMNYQYQASSATTFAVSGTVCGSPSNAFAAVFQHVYRVWLKRTIWV